MENQYPQDSSGSTQHYNFKPKSHDDEAMGGIDDGSSTTPTGGYSNGQPASRRQSVQSGEYSASTGPFPVTPDPEANTRYPSSNMLYHQQQPMQPVSRPSSGLSGSGDRYAYPQSYQEQSQRSSHASSNPAQKEQSSVVIKVGMVGDAQIGKTSLMVKYVEGSWDEDYIQTLGGSVHVEACLVLLTSIEVSTLWKRRYPFEIPK